MMDAVIGEVVCVVHTDAVEGVTVTVLRVFAVMVMTDGAADILVTPLSEALTQRLTVPAVVPAVNVTGFPVVELRLPIPVLPSVHE